MIIVFRKFNNLAICGEVDIAEGTPLETSSNFATFKSGEQITRLYSENYIKHFARDDDGNGMERGKLTYAIAHAPREGKTGARLTDDECEILRRDWSRYLMPYDDTILFNNSFYDASIEDLRLIANALNIEV